MKKLLTICLFLATTFTVSAQSESTFRTISGLGSLMGMSSENAESFLNKNDFNFDNEGEKEVKNNITFETYLPNKYAGKCMIGLKNEKVVLVMLQFQDLSENEKNIIVFRKDIEKFKKSLIGANFKLVNEKKEADGNQTTFFYNKALKQKADVSHSDGNYVSFIIYSDEIDLSKLN